MPPKGSRSSSSSSSASSRAASLLAKARAASASTAQAKAAAPKREVKPKANDSSSLPGFSATSDAFPSSSAPNTYPSTSSATSASAAFSSSQLPLPLLLKRLTTRGHFTIREAIPIAGKLLKARLATEEALGLLSNAALEERAGIESQDERTRIIAACSALQPGQGRARKKRRADPFEDDELLSREWGNTAGPSSGASPRKQLAPTTPLLSYTFNEILTEAELRGRYCYVNRAPVLTAWCVVVLERLGFNRREALSVAQCYVAITATARGRAIGVLPAASSSGGGVVGSSQPHFELMGVKIPVMQVDVPGSSSTTSLSDEQPKEWRGISSEEGWAGGECVGPDKAFNYLRKSMAQTLPLVVGALSALADSFMLGEGEGVRDQVVKGEIKEEGVGEVGDAVASVKEEDGQTDVVKAEASAAAPPKAEAEDSKPPSPSPPPAYGPDVLHARAYELYTLFRPSTGGQWGKRARFELDRVLALRKGREDVWEREWAHRRDDEGEEGQESGGGGGASGEVKGEAVASGGEQPVKDEDEAEQKALQEDIDRAIREAEEEGERRREETKRVKLEHEH